MSEKDNQLQNSEKLTYSFEEIGKELVSKNNNRDIMNDSLSSAASSDNNPQLKLNLNCNKLPHDHSGSNDNDPLALEPRMNESMDDFNKNQKDNYFSGKKEAHVKSNFIKKTDANKNNAEIKTCIDKMPFDYFSKCEKDSLTSKPRIKDGEDDCFENQTHDNQYDSSLSKDSPTRSSEPNIKELISIGHDIKEYDSKITESSDVNGDMKNLKQEVIRFNSEELNFVSPLSYNECTYNSIKTLSVEDSNKSSDISTQGDHFEQNFNDFNSKKTTQIVCDSFNPNQFDDKNPYETEIPKECLSTDPNVSGHGDPLELNEYDFHLNEVKKLTSSLLNGNSADFKDNTFESQVVPDVVTYNTHDNEDTLLQNCGSVDSGQIKSKSSLKDCILVKKENTDTTYTYNADVNHISKTDIKQEFSDSKEASGVVDQNYVYSGHDYVIIKNKTKKKKEVPRLYDILGYNYTRKTRNSNATFWHCTLKNCCASIRADENEYKRVKLHNHEGNINEFLSVQKKSQEDCSNALVLKEEVKHVIEDTIINKKKKFKKVEIPLYDRHNMKPKDKLLQRKSSYIVIKNEDGCEKLMDNYLGYIYFLQKMTERTKLWVCNKSFTNKKCKATVKQVGNCFICSKSQHNHSVSRSETAFNKKSFSEHKTSQRPATVTSREGKNLKSNKSSLSPMSSPPGLKNTTYSSTGESTSKKRRKTQVLESDSSNSSPTSLNHGGSSIDTKLSKKHQEALIELFLFMNAIGIPLTNKIMMNTFTDYLNSENLQIFPSDGNKPRRSWVSRFVGEHKEELGGKYIENCSYNELLSISAVKVQTFFDDLMNLLENYSINIEKFLNKKNAHRIFNCDSIEFLVRRSAKNVKSQNKLTLVMNVICCVSADGFCVKPTIVNEGKVIPKYDVQNENEAFKKLSSENGQITGEIFLTWLSKTFINHLKEKNIERPVILFLNGTNHIVSRACLKFAYDNKIILYHTPPYTARSSQPLSINLFRKLRKNYQKLVEYNFGQNYLPYKLFPKHFMNAMNFTDISGLAIKGFQVTGICPFNTNKLSNSSKIKLKKNNQRSGLNSKKSLENPKVKEKKKLPHYFSHTSSSRNKNLNVDRSRQNLKLPAINKKRKALQEASNKKSKQVKISSKNHSSVTDSQNLEVNKDPSRVHGLSGVSNGKWNNEKTIMDNDDYFIGFENDNIPSKEMIFESSKKDENWREEITEGDKDSRTEKESSSGDSKRIRNYSKSVEGDNAVIKEASDSSCVKKVKSCNSEESRSVCVSSQSNVDVSNSEVKSLNIECRSPSEKDFVLESNCDTGEKSLPFTSENCRTLEPNAVAETIKSKLEKNSSPRFLREVKDFRSDKERHSKTNKVSFNISARPRIALRRHSIESRHSLGGECFEDYRSKQVNRELMTHSDKSNVITEETTFSVPSNPLRQSTDAELSGVRRCDNRISSSDFQNSHSFSSINPVQRNSLENISDSNRNSNKSILNSVMSENKNDSKEISVNLNSNLTSISENTEHIKDTCTESIQDRLIINNTESTYNNNNNNKDLHIGNEYIDRATSLKEITTSPLKRRAFGENANIIGLTNGFSDISPDKSNGKENPYCDDSQFEVLSSEENGVSRKNSVTEFRVERSLTSVGSVEKMAFMTGYELALSNMETVFNAVVDPCILQLYEAKLKTKQEFPDTSFLVWRGLQKLRKVPDLLASQE